MPDDLTGAIPEGGTPPAPVTTVEGAVPGVTPTDTDTGGPSVDPLLGRFRALGATTNDLEMVERLYGGSTEAETLRETVSGLEGRDSLRDYADQLMDGLDSSLHEEHKAWRGTYGDAAYVESLLKQRSRETGETPAETEDERIARLVKEQVASTMQPILAKREQETARQVFDSDLDQILGGMKLSEGFKKHLRDDVQANVNPDIRNAAELATLVQKRHSTIAGFLASESKATPSVSTPVVAEAPPPPTTGSSPGFSDKDEPLTTDQIVDDAVEFVGAQMETGTGAS